MSFVPLLSIFLNITLEHFAAPALPWHEFKNYITAGIGLYLSSTNHEQPLPITNIITIIVLTEFRSSFCAWDPVLIKTAICFSSLYLNRSFYSTEEEVHTAVRGGLWITQPHLYDDGIVKLVPGQERCMNVWGLCIQVVRLQWTNELYWYFNSLYNFHNLVCTAYVFLCQFLIKVAVARSAPMVKPRSNQRLPCPYQKAYEWSIGTT